MSDGCLQGECDKNTWMLENCRQSCHSCYSNRELSQVCRVYKGRRPRSIGFGPMGMGASQFLAFVETPMQGSEALDLGNVESV